MTTRQRLVQTARDVKGYAAAIGAILLLGSASAALLALVIRGDPSKINDWGLLIGMFITAGSGMLTEARQGHRVTDPAPGQHTTIESEPAP